MRTDTIKHFFGCTLTARAKHIVWVCIFMWAGIMPLSAQVYSTAKGGRYDASYSSEYNAMQQSSYSVQDAQVGYNAYQSTVYQPFESSLPSDNNPVYSNGQGEGNDRQNAPTNRRNLQGGGDPGTQGDSPVGEAWVMLFFAAAAALAIFIRQRRAVLRG